MPRLAGGRHFPPTGARPREANGFGGAEQEAVEERHLRQMDKDFDRQSKDLERMMRATFAK
jgi:hypothetical protein